MALSDNPRQHADPVPAKADPPSLFQRFLKLPWKTIAFASHVALYIALTLLMFFWVDGYLAYDDAQSSSPSPSQHRSRLRSSEVITVVSAMTTVLGWLASIWFGGILVKSGYLVWVNNRETGSREDAVEKIRWTLDYRWPRKLGSDTGEHVGIRIVLLMLFPALLSSPVLQGALDWKSSSEAAGQGMVSTRNPSAVFWDWNFALRGGGLTEEKWEAASLGGIIWDNTTSSDTHQPCRHLLAGGQFRVGSRLINATLPCLTVHSVTWPKTNSTNQAAEGIVDDVILVSPSGELVFGFTPGTIALFDATNKTLPLPPKFGDGFEPLGDIVALTQEPPYPAPFLWSGVMTAIVLIAKNLPYPPYRIDPFGIDRANNNISRGTSISFAMDEMLPERIYTYLQVNFTAGVVRPAASTYVRPNVVEAYANGTGSGGIQPGPWVREAMYLTSDTMNCMAKSNSTGVPTWHNLENYTSQLVRIAYMSAWTNLQFKFEPNSTDLVVEIQEPRLQAVVERWRVVLWTAINVLFSCSWLLVRVLFKGQKEVHEVDGFAGFVAGVYNYLERKEPTMGDSTPLIVECKDGNMNRDGDGSEHNGTATRPVPSVGRRAPTW